SAARRATRELLSRRSPNTIASDGQACAQAGVLPPSRTLRSSRRARFWAPRMRCTQKVHFSITPFSRTVTSGLRSMLSGSDQLSHSLPLSAKLCQLKLRMLYGQLFVLYRVPTHRMLTWPLILSGVLLGAFPLKTCTPGALPPLW